MVSAFAEAGIVRDERYAEVAETALAFVRDRLWDGETLSRRWKGGDVKGDGYLEDYAFLARGALHTYEATGEVDHLAFALELARALVDGFYDADRGTLYFTPEGGESLVARPQELGDSSTPSSTGVAVETLDALSHFTTDDELAAVAETVTGTHASTLESSPLQHAALTLAADALAVGRHELTVAADALPDEWRATLGERYLPLRLLSVRPPTDEGLAPWLDRLGLETAPSIWAGREARDGPTVYACRNRACSPPRDDLTAALDWTPT
jgi:hypothetical protein